MSIYKIAENVLFQEIDGEAVLLSLDEGCYYGLDEVGTRVWRMLDEDTEPAQMVAKIVEEYDVEPEQARRDLDALIDDLEKSGLIRQQQR